jgi:hypothetical protein
MTVLWRGIIEMWIIIAFTTAAWGHYLGRSADSDDKNLSRWLHNAALFLFIALAVLIWSLKRP